MVFGPFLLKFFLCSLAFSFQIETLSQKMDQDATNTLFFIFHTFLSLNMCPNYLFAIIAQVSCLPKTVWVFLFKLIENSAQLLVSKATLGFPVKRKPKKMEWLVDRLKMTHSAKCHFSFSLRVIKDVFCLLHLN